MAVSLEAMAPAVSRADGLSPVLWSFSGSARPLLSSPTRLCRAAPGLGLVGCCLLLLHAARPQLLTQPVPPSPVLRTLLLLLPFLSSALWLSFCIPAGRSVHFWELFLASLSPLLVRSLHFVGFWKPTWPGLSWACCCARPPGLSAAVLLGLTSAVLLLSPGPRGHTCPQSSCCVSCALLLPWVRGSAGWSWLLRSC